MYLLLILYLFIGYLDKYIPNVEIVQMLSGFIIICFAVYKIFISGLLSDISRFIIFSLFVSLIIVFYSIDVQFNEYTTNKPKKIFFLLALSYSVAILFAKNEVSIKKFITYNKYAVLVLFFISLIELPNSLSLSSRISLLGSNPIWLARAFGILIIIAYYNIVNKIHKFLIILLSLLIIFLTKSEGPLFALFVVFLLEIYSYLKPKLSSYGRMFIFVISCSFLSIFYSYIINLVDFNGRLYLYEIGIQQFFSNPYGSGIGYFSEISVSSLPYPHNIFIEILLEYGIIVFSIICISVVSLFMYFLKNINKISIVMKIVFMLFIFEVINAQFSGDTTSPKLGYIMLFILIEFVRMRKGDSLKKKVLVYSK